MSQEKKAMIVEAKILHKLQKGSYEELLQSLDRVIAENQSLFGDGEAVLFSSFVDHAVVLNESGEFFRVSFSNKDGVVTLRDVDVLDVSVLSEGDVASKGVDNFFGGGSLAESLKGIVRLNKQTGRSPLERMESALVSLFSGGQLWRKYLNEKKRAIGDFAWDAEYGNLRIDIRPVFGDISDDALDEDVRDTVMGKLVELERRLHGRLGSVKEDYTKYQNESMGGRDDESDEVLSRFESFASDYIDYLSEVADFVSGVIRQGRDGCILCAALVHDEVAKRYKELELGGRFVRKIATQFVR